MAGRHLAPEAPEAWPPSPLAPSADTSPAARAAGLPPAVTPGLPRRADLRAVERARATALDRHGDHHRDRHPARRPAAVPEGPATHPTRRELRRDQRPAHRPSVLRPGRLTYLVVALVVVIGALVSLGAGGLRLLDGSRQATLSAGPGATPGPSASAASAGGGTAGAPSAVRAVQAVLDARSTALLARDRDGWLAPVAGPGSVSEPARGALAAYAARTAQLFDRLDPVALSAWHWEVTGSGAPLDAQRSQQLPAGSWVARTTLVWSLEGAGDDPVRRQQDLTVVPSASGAGWAIADDADGDTVPDLWDLGDVAVVDGERAVVLGTAGSDELTRLADVATTAAEGVDAVWGTDWPRRTVLEVPADQAQMARLLGRDDDAGLDQIAAVTTGELTGGDGATRGDHVVINPTGFGQLAPLGQRVVLTHELTHVATRHDAVRAVPLWLSEGFADWVGYRGTGLSRQVVAADLLASVRADGPPADLPTADDFDPSRRQVGPAYSGAWLAVDSLARRYGEDQVVGLYRAASQTPLPQTGTTAPPAGSDPTTDAAEAALDTALASVMGTDHAALVTGWQTELTQLAAP